MFCEYAKTRTSVFKGTASNSFPAEKELKINTTVLPTEDNGRIILEPAKSMKESFGEGGDKARQAAIEISIERRKEVEPQRKMPSG